MPLAWGLGEISVAQDSMRPTYRTFAVLALACGLALGVCAGPAAAKSRIKDIVNFEGVRENQLIGYGVVVGLNGTGDALRNNAQTKQSLENMLERSALNVRAADLTLNTKNMAAVIVTANLPPFATPGMKFDVT